MATMSSVSFSKCLFLSYSALSLSSHEPCPLLYWALLHLQQAFISLSWAFIRTCLEIFNHLSQIWAYDVFITFGLSLFIHLSSFFFFFGSSPLVRIYRSLPFKAYEFLIILGLSMQLGGSRLGNFILSFRMLDAKSIAYLLP